jgi:flagellar M-ring protein FliF
MNKGLPQVAQQLQQIWKQLGLNQRVSIVLATMAVLVGLGSLGIWSTRTDYALLYGKLDDAEAAKVLAALDDAKTPYKVNRGGGAIMVPADKVHVTRMQLAAKGIPRGDGVGFEIFDKPNFGISDFVQRANYLRAVQGELARTISQVDAVEHARVMIVMPENRLLLDNQKKPTASVFVKVRGNAQLPAQTVNAVRFLVANAVEGLQANHVTVVDNLGNVLSENNDNDSIAGLTTTQLAARKNIEQYLTKKAEGMLDKVLGPGQAVVRVSADIDFDSETRTEEKFDPEGQVARSTTINDENTETVSANGTSGVPGVTTNSDTESNVTSVASSPVNNSRTKKKVTNNQYEINKITSQLIQNPGGFKRLSAAVFVAAKYEGAGAERKVAPRSKEELEKLRRIVQSALGIQNGTGESERKDEITLEEMPFNDAPAIEFAQQFDKQQRVQFWIDVARQAAYPAIALLVLFVFWRTFKRTPAADIPIGIPLGDFAGENGNGKNGTHTNGKGATPAVTVDVLNQLIRENPENMTQAIRTWMTRGKTK